MNKILYILILLIVKNNLFAQEHDLMRITSEPEYVEKTILLSGGYSQVLIDGNIYSGYNTFLKFFLPFSNEDDHWYFGLGVRYENVISKTTSPNDQKNTFSYETAQAGLDLAYKLSFSIADIQINPYLYYSFYNKWTRDTEVTGTTITASPDINYNFTYGIGGSLLFKLGIFYLGPSIYYSRGYLSYNSFKDNYGDSYNQNSGSYQFLNYNLTLGVLL